MDFSLEPKYTKEQEEFAKEVREWLDKNIPEGMISPRDPAKMSNEQWQKRRELGRRLGQKGWLCPSYPPKYGGGGLDGNHVTILMRELAERHIGLPPYPDSGIWLTIPVVLACGTEEQKERFLPPIMKGEAYAWQLFTEPEAGTDEANQQTNALRAVREEEHFIVNGQKIFVGQMYSPPEQFLLLTRSDLEAPRHKNLAIFIVPANLPGISIVPDDLFTPCMFPVICGPDTDGADTFKYSVFFDDVRIHESCLIGGDHDGWMVATSILEVEHAGVGEVWVPPNVVVEKFLARCKNDPSVVKRLRENPQLVDSVVDIYIGAQIERLFAIRNAGGKGGDYEGPQLLLYQKMFGARIIPLMAKVLGPYTLTNDDEWGLDDGTFEIAQRAGVCLADGGTPEALKIGMSRALSIGR